MKNNYVVAKRGTRNGQKWPTHTFVSFSSSQSLANELKNVIKSVTTDNLLKVTELASPCRQMSCLIEKHYRTKFCQYLVLVQRDRFEPKNALFNY